MIRYIRIFSPWILVMLLTAGAGAMAGKFNNRWGQPVDLIAAGERLDQVRQNFGDWEMLQEFEFDADVAQMLQCSGHLHRAYRHKPTGDVVNMFVIVGPPGPISVHTPEICYSSRDYDIIAPRERLSVGDGQTFWGLSMRGNDLMANAMHIAYAWSAGQNWQAAEQPRFTFGGQPLLYKLQLSSRTADNLPESAEKTSERFLKEFLPVIQADLLGSASAS
jgi:hypothetical protein